MELKGKVAVITGGAHRVGREITLGLARKGCDVLIHFHASGDNANLTRAEAEGAGVKAFSASADLRSPAEVVELF
ncbi:MAG TPA: SDR family NAD(P)-dependent oxidoreductase, partial [Anaerolineales bacterium]|nr:SDR family NAD(P)-dependent oxidoreductase [Anaerolineales bacterium]